MACDAHRGGGAGCFSADGVVANDSGSSTRVSPFLNCKRHAVPPYKRSAPRRYKLDGLRVKATRSKMARTDHRAKNKQHSGCSKGLMKKADELSQLCDAKVHVVIQHYRTKTLHGLFVEPGILMASTVVGSCNYLPLSFLAQTDFLTA